MRTSAVAGIVFANVKDDLLRKLTTKRSMASVPFGARYRLIDFTLSNLVNAGISNVGIITKENYRSLMDHVGSGIYWDLDRKSGGLYLLPPYSTSGARRYNGTVDALNGAHDFIKRCKSEYIVLCDADLVANVDIAEALKAHVEKDADVTVVYHKGEVPRNTGETMLFKLDGENRVTEIDFNEEGGIEALFGLGITIISRSLLDSLVNEAIQNDLVSFNEDILARKVKQLKIYGFEHSEYAAVMCGTNTYYSSNIDLLNCEVRHQLFSPERPIYTKDRDDMPTRYGTKAKVNNSLIADGCIIDGTVKNSILFRGVKVEKGAVVENCILMQETVVKADAQLDNVISDKNGVIGEKMVLKGTAKKHFFVKKNEII